MKRITTIAVLLCAALTGCASDGHDNPFAPVRSDAVMARALAVAATNPSALCLSYRARLAQTETALSQARGDARLRREVAAYKAIIVDACG
jgi:hypothetical protein